uniref:Hydrophobin n=1 Tax=Hypocrea virens TaxID=29875 RepID=A7LNX0_HYPVI|nr:hydrophobin [Trichoderma virens]
MNMKLLILAGIFTTGAFASIPCSGNQNTPLCCAVDVLGVASLDCQPPPGPVNSSEDLQQQCRSVGLESKCCALSLLGQAIGCTNPGN